MFLHPFKYNIALITSQIALKNGIDYATVLGQLREARNKGLTVPILLMGIISEAMSLNSQPIRVK